MCSVLTFQAALWAFLPFSLKSARTASKFQPEELATTTPPRYSPAPPRSFRPRRRAIALLIVLLTLFVAPASAASAVAPAASQVAVSAAGPAASQAASAASAVSAAAAAPSAPAARSPVVTGIAIEGLTRTRPSTVERILDVELPAPAADLDLESLRQRLLRSGLFVDSVHIELVPAEAVSTEALVPAEAASTKESTHAANRELTLLVQLEERWTLIPLPIAAYGSGGWMAGAALLESNLRGTGTLLIAAAMLQGDGASIDEWRTALGVSGGVLQRGRLQPGLFLSAGAGEVGLVNADGGEYRRFRRTAVSARASLDYRLSDAVTLGTAGAVSVTEIDPDWSQSERPPQSTAYYLQDLSLTAERRSRVGHFEAGPLAQAQYRQGLPLDGGQPFGSASVHAEYGIPLYGSHKLLLGARATLGNAPATELPELSGAGFRTLPARGTRAQRAAAAAVELELAVLRLRWVTVTAPLFFEGGVYTPDDSLERFSGPGGGVRLYLARVAFPAVGFTVGYNLQNAKPTAGIALGMRL